MLKERIDRNWWTSSSKNDSDWIAVQFSKTKPRTVSAVKVYLYEKSSSYELPKSLVVEYLQDSTWVPVAEKFRVPSVLTGNTENTIRFDSVSTTQVRVVLYRNTSFKRAMAVSELSVMEDSLSTDVVESPKLSDLSANRVSLLRNPVEDRLEITGVQSAGVCVYNLLGVSMLETRMEMGFPVDVSVLKNGWYMARISSGAERYGMKFLKIKL